MHHNQAEGRDPNADHSRRAAARLATEVPRAEERCLQMRMAGDASARALKAIAKVLAPLILQAWISCV